MSTLILIGLACLIAGGGFLLPFVYYRACRGLAWHMCIMHGLLGLVVYFLLLTTLAGIGTPLLLRDTSALSRVVAPAIMIGLILIPYLAAIWIALLRCRKSRAGRGSNA
jgi:hypothetical protein